MFTAIRLCGVLLLLALCGCGGRLYTDITKPYTRNFNATPVGSKEFVVENHKVKAPMGNGQISGEWDTGVIVKAAKEAGIEKIYYADKRTLSVFFGVYRRETLILYGD